MSFKGVFCVAEASHLVDNGPNPPPSSIPPVMVSNLVHDAELVPNEDYLPVWGRRLNYAVGVGIGIIHALFLRVYRSFGR